MRAEMAIRGSESVFDRLPEDTMSLIFQKLPLKTLVDCTLVSKYFNSFIRNPNFVYTYDANIASNDESYISCHWYTPDDLKITCSFDSRSTGWTKEYILNSSSAFGDLPGKLRFEAVGSCNGLICLKECWNKRVILWNPRIMKTFILPNTRHNHLLRLGLGFSSKDNDYKVLIVNNYRDLKLYSLKLNSWRSIGSAPASIIGGCFPCPPMVFAGGSLHYIEMSSYLKGVGYSNSIVAFDLGNEVLRTIALPETLRTQGEATYRRLSISEYNGSASIAVFARVSNWSWLHEVWLMREYGSEDSWLKLSFDDFDHHLPRMPILYFRTYERLRVNLKDDDIHPHAYDIDRAYPLAYDIDRAGAVSFKFGARIESIDDCRNKPMFCYKEEGHQYYFYASRLSLALLDK